MSRSSGRSVKRFRSLRVTIAARAAANRPQKNTPAPRCTPWRYAIASAASETTSRVRPSKASPRKVPCASQLHQSHFFLQPQRAQFVSDRVALNSLFQRLRQHWISLLTSEKSQPETFALRSLDFQCLAVSHLSNIFSLELN